MKNPVRSKTVKTPTADDNDVEVWDQPMFKAAKAKMPAQQRAMVDLAVGAGHRQGEVFASAKDDVTEGEILVCRQIKVIGGSTLIFDLPKGRKTRRVPLSEPLAIRLAKHIEEHGTTRVTLPWRTPHGKPHTADLLFVTQQGKAIHRTDWNETVWHPARAAAGAPATREHGFHVLRHTAASAWLSSGIDILKVAALARARRSVVHAEDLHPPHARVHGGGP